MAKTKTAPKIIIKDHDKEIVVRDIDSLQPFDKNPRLHDDDQIDALIKLINQYGFYAPVIINAESKILAGHGRIQALRKMGRAQVETRTVRGLSPAEERGLLLADNRSALSATWSDEFVSFHMKELDAVGFPLDLTGFEIPEIQKFLSFGVTNTGKTDDDAVPAVPKTPKSKPGDVWLLDNHRVMCASCLEPDNLDKLLLGQQAELLFTDPPYGVNYEGGHFHSGDIKIKREREKLEADGKDTDIYAEFMPLVPLWVDGPCYVFYAGTKSYEVFKALKDNSCQVSSVLVWHKTNAKYAAMGAQYKQRHEPIVYFKPKGSILRWNGKSDESTLWEEKRDPVNELHPTQKPVALAERAIKNHIAGTVLDMFGGSGSTLIACQKLERACRVIEISPAYVDVIVKRWCDYTGREALLESTGEKF